jgi:hypothetical protein
MTSDFPTIVLVIDKQTQLLLHESPTLILCTFALPCHPNLEGARVRAVEVEEGEEEQLPAPVKRVRKTQNHQ